MKIAIDCRLIGQSGIGTFIENVVHHIVEAPDMEFVLIGNRDRLSVYSARANCSIVECNYESFSLKELFCFPTKEVNKCDAFFTPYINIPLGISIPVFSTVHDVVFFDVRGLCSPLGKLIRYIYIKRALCCSKTVFTVSEFSKGRIEALFRPKSTVCVCYSGISEELVNYKEHSDVREKKNQIVYLGNLKKQKGIDILLRAFSIVRKQMINPPVLVVIGNFNFRTKDTETIELIKGADKGIIFLQNADNRKVFDTLSESLALISPSIYEGLGLPPMEAMYLGTQAVISDIPVYKEIYGSTNATFFATGDSEDLARKIMCIDKDGHGDLSTIVEDKHNFQTISNVILNRIKEIVVK